MTGIVSNVLLLNFIEATVFNGCTLLSPLENEIRNGRILWNTDSTLTHTHTPSTMNRFVSQYGCLAPSYMKKLVISREVLMQSNEELLQPSHQLQPPHCIHVCDPVWYHNKSMFLELI